MPNGEKIPPVAALFLWNIGLNLRQIAAIFPGSSRMAAQRAIKRATDQGYTKRAPLPDAIAGRTRYKKKP